MMLRSVILLLAVAPAPLLGWSKQSQVDIAWEAARLAPPDLYRQIIKHKAAYRDGLVEPFGYEDPTLRQKNQDGTGTLDVVLAEQTRLAVEAIESHRPFEDIVHQLGIALHYVILANNPLVTSTADPTEPTYASDFSTYMASTIPRLPALFYGLDPHLHGPEDLDGFIDRTLKRSRALYPYIGQEYRRIGGASGVELFDDRSTAFGVVGVSFSRAMTDAVVVLRYVWLQAGGADTLPRQSAESGRLLKLSRSP